MKLIDDSKQPHRRRGLSNRASAVAGESQSQQRPCTSRGGGNNRSSAQEGGTKTQLTRQTSLTKRRREFSFLSFVLKGKIRRVDVGTHA